MQRQDLLRLKTVLLSITILRGLLSDRVISALCGYLDSLMRKNTAESVSLYSEFVSRLYEKNAGDLTRHIENILYDSENVYVRMIGLGETPGEHITECLKHELRVLSVVSSLSSEELMEPLEFCGFLPRYLSSNVDLYESYMLRVENIGRFGYGKYARNRMFSIDDNGNIIPVENPDRISLESLVDYEYQRNLIINNTRALIAGKPAANILLTGDAGTGKSSTVKAVANEFFSEGLRIIEVRKEQLGIIPRILNELSANPLKFILFIDDLSFLSDDDNFNGLKAVLEGSVSARSDNTVVYATSNRRHIIRERFADREGDEIHRNDAMQEMISLSDRFGLHITFEKPSKQTYLNIVRQLAEKSSVDMEQSELELLAERFALERGGRSARLARQFIDKLLSNED